MQIKLSAIDRKILRLLQHNADLSAAEVAEHVELSQSPCWRRIHRLQEEGLIERKVALLNPKKTRAQYRGFRQCAAVRPRATSFDGV